MEQKEKETKSDPLSTQFEDMFGNGKEKEGEKRPFRDACDAGGLEGVTKVVVIYCHSKVFMVQATRCYTTYYAR